MSCYLKYLIITIFIMFSKSEIEYSTCIDNKRTITLENGTSLTFDCTKCQENEYAFYSLENRKLECSHCPENSYSYSNSGDIVIDTFSKKFLKRYSLSFNTICDSDDKNLCPKWENYILSLKVENIKENVDSKSILKLNEYYYMDGKFIIKYLNYNGDFNKYVHIYINKILVYKDDTRHSKIKTIEFEIKQGYNEIEIIYVIDKNLSSKDHDDIESFFEIYEIRMEKADTVSFECQRFDPIDSLKNSLMNNCDYFINKCSSNEICTFRFYSENSEGNNIKGGKQIVSYNKIEGGICEELIKPSKIEIEANQCSYGQFRKLKENSENIYTCDNCLENKYNDKLVNYEFSCEKVCDTTTKVLKKIYHVNNFVDQSEYSLNLVMNEIIGYIEVNYEKYNLKEDAIIFVEKAKEAGETNTYQLINPNIQTDISSENFLFKIPFVKGQYKFNIKGKNMKLKEIKVINGEVGGNYQCVNKLIPEEQVLCKENEYYSSNKKICDECPYGTFIKDNSQCIFTQQIISNKFILENSLLLQNDILYDQKIIKEENNYHLFLNPSFPLIYLTKSDGTSQIIGNEFSRVKLIRGINDRGIILSYTHKDNDLNYTTYIYLKCHQSEEKLEFIKEEENESGKYFYFIVQSNLSCPYCLESEIEEGKTDGKCINNKELINIIPKKSSVCVIKSFDNSTSSNITINENDNMLLFYNSSNTEDQNLINNFKIIEQIPLFNEKDSDKIVTETQRYKECKNEDENGEDSLGAGYIVLIVVGSFIVVAVIGFIIVRMIKKKKEADDDCKNEPQELTLKSSKEDD